MTIIFDMEQSISIFTCNTLKIFVEIAFSDGDIWHVTKHAYCETVTFSLSESRAANISGFPFLSPICGSSSSRWKISPRHAYN